MYVIDTHHASYFPATIEFEIFSLFSFPSSFLPLHFINFMGLKSIFVQKINH
jgi:hypothetical protein